MTVKKSGPMFTRVRWVRGKDRQAIASWFESLGFRVTIWGADKTDDVWEIMYVPDDRVTSPPPVDIDLDSL